MRRRNSEMLSQIVTATSGRKMGRDKYRKTCNSYGCLWSRPYYMGDFLKVFGLSFRYCERCHEVRWL